MKRKSFKIMRIALILGIVFASMLPANVVLAQTIDVTVSGTVKDNSGNPVTDAEVRVIDPTTQGIIASDLTDSTGNYTLSVDPGTYDVKVIPPVGSEFGPAIALGLVLTSNTILNFVLVPVGAVTLSGKVLDPMGDGIPGQEVQLSPVGSNNWIVSTTDNEGNYFLQVAPGDYDIYVRGQNAYTSPPVNAAYDYMVRNNYVDGVYLSLTESMVMDIPLPEHKVSVHVQDPVGNSVPGVTISTNSVWNTDLTLGPIAAFGDSQYYYSYPNMPTTDASGDVDLWLFTTPPGGAYTLIATPPAGSGLAGTSLSNVSITDETSVIITLVVPVTLSGKVLDPMGDGIPGQEVQLSPVGSNNWIVSTTDNEGNYFLQVAPGDYDIYVRGQNAYTSPPVNAAYDYMVRNNYVDGVYLSLTESMVMDIPLPEHKVSVHVQDPVGNSVPGVTISTNSVWNTDLTLGPIAAFGDSQYYYSYPNMPTTDASGDVDLWLFTTPPGGDTYTLTATPPTGSPFVTFDVYDVEVVSDMTIIVVLEFVHPPPVTTAGVSPAPDGQGIYHEPVTVTLSATAYEGYTIDATYYIIDDGETQTYAGPFDIVTDGTHTIDYWSVDDVGVFEIQQRLTLEILLAVDFPDPNLKLAIREAINKPYGDIYQSDLDDLTYFTAGDRGIVDLTGLEHCTSLTLLGLGQNQISDVTPLSNLTSLTYLYLDINQISDITPLSNLTSLTYLPLGDNQISDITPLSNLTSLTQLYLDLNQISDIDSLSNLTSMTWLGLGQNQISDIDSLSNLTSLTGLNLEQNQISDITPLSNLTSLAQLSLDQNQISDIIPLSSLSSLTWLGLGRNQISDITPLSNLTSLAFLALEQNQISDITPLSNLTSLWYLALGQNQISEIDSLSNLTSMTQLYLEVNQISDIDSLSNMTSMIALTLEVNQISDIIPLSNMTSLTELALGQNQISEIDSLSNLTSLTWLGLSSNQISDIYPLVQNVGMDEGDRVNLKANPLSYVSLFDYIPELLARGVNVLYDIPPNLPPTADAGGPYPADEGEIITLNASGSTDPDDNIVLYEWDLDNDGEYDDASGVTADVAFDDDGTYTVGLRVTDEYGESDTDTASVTVDNVAPAANAGEDKAGNEPASFTFAGSHTDPGVVDTHTYEWDFDYDGVTFDVDASGTSVINEWADDFAGSVALRVTDDDGGWSIDTCSVTVSNVAPVANAGEDKAGNEPASFTFTGSHTDPGVVDTHTYEWDFDYDGVTFDVDASGISGINEWADGFAGSVALRVTDDDGGWSINTCSVTVSNVAPTVGAITAPVDPIEVDTEFTAQASFTDPGTGDTWTAEWDWGDGTETLIEDITAPGDVDRPHTYTLPDVYTITLTVTDDDGGTHQSKFEFVVVYDPAAGFATGGGWFIPGKQGNSDFDDDLPGLDGTSKATFGFVVKYRKGASITPSGQLEFQYRVGDFSLHSGDYDWLVVTNTNWAKFQGLATIKGRESEGLFPFRVDSFDGDGTKPDRFIIRIWLPGADPDIGDPEYKASGDLGGGQIMIHK